MLHKIIFTAFLMILAPAPAEAAPSRCEEIFASHVLITAPHPSEHEISQSIDGIAALQLRVDLAHARGDQSAINQTLVRDIQLRREDLAQTTDLAPQEINERIRRSVERIQKETAKAKSQRDEQNIQVNGYRIDGRRIEFHRLDSASFTFFDGYKHVPVEIHEPFEMAATLTTQIVWRKVAEAAKQRLDNLNPNEVNSDPSYFKNDLCPVETVSYTDIQNWFTYVNRLAAMNDPVIFELFPGHEDGDLYRLPWEDEWDYVISARGKIESTFSFGNNARDLHDYAWSRWNSSNPELSSSEKSTQPVATKEPFVLDGNAFFDMHGNVREWMNDDYKKEIPVRHVHANQILLGNHIIRGGSYNDDAWALESKRRTEESASLKLNTVGFRIVRYKQAKQ